MLFFVSRETHGVRVFNQYFEVAQLILSPYSCRIEDSSRMISMVLGCKIHIALRRSMRKAFNRSLFVAHHVVQLIAAATSTLLR